MGKTILVTFLTSCATFGAKTTVTMAAKGVSIGVTHIAHALHHVPPAAKAVAKHVAS